VKILPTAQSPHPYRDNLSCSQYPARARLWTFRIAWRQIYSGLFLSSPHYDLACIEGGCRGKVQILCGGVFSHRRTGLLLQWWVRLAQWVRIHRQTCSHEHTAANGTTVRKHLQNTGIMEGFVLAGFDSHHASKDHKKPVCYVDILFMLIHYFKDALQSPNSRLLCA